MNKVNLIDFPNAFRLWELCYSQKLLSDKVTLKGGIMSVDRDFIVPDYYNSIGSINFVNQTFFYPTLAFNLYDIPGLPPGDHALAFDALRRARIAACALIQLKNFTRKPQFTMAILTEVITGQIFVWMKTKARWLILKPVIV